MAIIKFEDVWEIYKIKFTVNSKSHWEDFVALKGINFQIDKGEIVGIIGENGAGKTTILKLIAGMLKPDRGEVVVLGTAFGLLELGAGFQPELTGTENIYLSAGLFGLTQKQIQEKYEHIVEFADLGKFINAPLKYYSQGMFVRLAFSVAINMNPDILLIDDTLTVGDARFQNRCIKKIFELKEQNATIIIVTHDVSMLNRFCKRALFLREGRIVKDGSVEKVIPLYAQTSGMKEGIGILGNSSLRVVFNNGRFLIYWNDRLLTPNPGAYSVLSINNTYYSSLKADWEVKCEGGNKLIAVGRFNQLGLIQQWKVEIAGNNEVVWHIEMETNDFFEIQEGFINLMLINEYTRWVTISCEGEFPRIDINNTNWQVLLSGNQFQKCVGAYAEENSDRMIPFFIFEQLNLSYSQAQVLNSDYLANCRVLQYKTPCIQNYDNLQSNRYVYFTGKIAVNNDNYIKRAREDSILSVNNYSLIFNNGYGMLYWKGISITKAAHMGSSMHANGRWYSSNLASWQIKREDNNILVFSGRWPNLPVIQIWRVGINDDFSLFWEVYLHVETEVNIEEQHIWLMCPESYKYWFCDYGDGYFPDNFLEIEVDVLQKCIPDGIIGMRSLDDRFPAISLKFSKDLNNFAKIFNTDFYNRARSLRIDRVEAEDKMRFQKGEYACFRAEISFNTNKQEDLGKMSYELQDEKLKFIFDGGKGRLYWDNIELTKKLSLYSSLRYEGKWHDSISSARWRVEENNGNIIAVVGKWFYLPIIQRWHILIRNENLIEFTITMKVESKFWVERLQTNIMFSEKYEQWTAGNIKSFFPSFNDNIDDDWEVLWSDTNHKLCANDNYVGVLRKNKSDSYMPIVRFSPEFTEPGWRMNIINSDICHRGRVLQYLHKEKRLFLPGEYLYSRGNIIFVQEH